MYPFTLEGLRGAINVLEHAGLRLRDERNIEHGPARWFRAARCIASHPGYYVICTANNAPGVIVRGQVWLFCDPNAGEATFTSAARFKNGVGRYANHRINRYRGANHATFPQPAPPSMSGG